MASVFAASHVSGQHHALKLLHPYLASDPLARKRFLREAIVSVRVRHPGAVKIIDAGTTPGNETFVAMELLQGTSLDALWRRAGYALPLPAVLHTVERLLDVLDACHRQGIVHRDIKPSNVFITDTGDVRLLDFGLARLPDGRDELAKPGVALGTPHFMAPEQAAGDWAHVDARSDVFSVGATLFALISGVRVHDGHDEGDTFQRAASRRVVSLGEAATGLPQSLIALADRALLWNKNQRFADAAEMREALRAVVLGFGDGPSLPMPMRHRTQLAVPPGVAEDPVALSLALAFASLEGTIDAPPEDPARVDSALRSAMRSLDDAANEAGAPLALEVKPFGFQYRGRTVWEPRSLYASVPRSLHAAGARAFIIAPGMHEHTAARFLALLRSACFGEARGDDLPLALQLWDTPRWEFETLFAPASLDVAAVHGPDAAAECQAVSSKLHQPVTQAKNGEATTRAVATAVSLLLDANRVHALQKRLASAHDASTDRLATALLEAIPKLPHAGSAWRDTAFTVARRLPVAQLREFLRSLAAIGSQPALDWLRQLAESDSPAIRILATAASLPPEGLLDVVRLSIDSQSDQDRIAALQLAEQLCLVPVATDLLARFDEAAFQAWSSDERDARLDLLFCCLPAEAERLSLRILQRQGVVADEARTVLRVASARALGRHALSNEAVVALRASLAQVWWNPRSLREEAAQALRTLEGRLSQPGAGA